MLGFYKAENEYNPLMLDFYKAENEHNPLMFGFFKAENEHNPQCLVSIRQKTSITKAKTKKSRIL